MPDAQSIPPSSRILLAVVIAFLTCDGNSGKSLVAAEQTPVEVLLFDAETCLYSEDQDHFAEEQGAQGFWGSYNCSSQRQRWHSETMIECKEEPDMTVKVCGQVSTNSTYWRSLQDDSCIAETYDIQMVHEEVLQVDYTAHIQQRRYTYICDTRFHFSQPLEELAKMGTIKNPLLTRHPLFPKDALPKGSMISSPDGNENFEFELLYGKLGPDSRERFYRPHF